MFNPDQADEDGDGVGDVSDDSDHDGVWNPQDECPGTPLGVKVDAFGCEIFYLPSDNFNVYKPKGVSIIIPSELNFENISHPILYVLYLVLSSTLRSSMRDSGLLQISPVDSIISVSGLRE